MPEWNLLAEMKLLCADPFQHLVAITRTKTTPITLTYRRIDLCPNKTTPCSGELWKITRSMCKSELNLHKFHFELIQFYSSGGNRRPKPIWTFWRPQDDASCTAWRCTPPKTTKEFRSILLSPTWDSPYFRESRASTHFRGPKLGKFPSSGRSFWSSCTPRDT